MHRSAVVLTVLLGASLTEGCGPLVSTYLIGSAEAELDGADAAEAEKYAVYEYATALEYLNKAKEEQGYADFGPAIDFAYKANDLAKKATNRADAEKRKLTERPAAEWEAPPEGSPEGQKPQVIIKKKSAPKSESTKKRVPIPPPDEDTNDESQE